MEDCGAKERMVLLSTKSKLEHYECEGQISIFDYQEPIYPLDIKGICDDYCKYRELYFSEHEDPDEAYEALLDEKCSDCPLGRIV